MKVVGIDPSLTSTGIVAAEGGQVTATMRVRSKAKGHERISEIVGTILAATSGADLVGIEGPAMGAKGSSVVQIFGLWGIITQELWLLHGDYYVVPPSTLKKYATGAGNASKDEVLARVVRDHPGADVTGNDVADALVIAAIGAHRAGEPLIAPTAYQTQALEKVQWGSNE